VAPRGDYSKCHPVIQRHRLNFQNLVGTKGQTIYFFFINDTRNRFYYTLQQLFLFFEAPEHRRVSTAIKIKIYYVLEVRKKQG